MPEIKSFRALRYDFSKIKEPADVLAPPYDVISSQQRDAFYLRHPHNVIRLILGKDQKSDSEVDNRYTRAGNFLKEWTQNGILKKDATPSIYVYVQDYPENSRKLRRMGFIAAMKLDLKNVLKHENTLAGPKKDRMALLKEVRTNLSPIFGLLEDSSGGLQRLLKQSLKLKPAIDVTIDGVRHRIFAESRSTVLKPLRQMVSPKPMFIADGHHRFEVACQYKEAMDRKHPGCLDAGWDYVMSYFSDCLHNPFKIFPTHRLVRIPKETDLLKIFESRGKIRKEKNLTSLLSRLSKNRLETRDRNTHFGFYSKKHGFYFFTLDKKFGPNARSDAAERLDVAVLHSRIIAPCFKIHAIEKSADIDFTRDAADARKKVDERQFDVAIFLRPISLDEMIEISKKGLKVPQKSTYFYPKLLSGLVFYSLTDDQA